MVKSLISLLCALFIIVGASVWENKYINKEFKEFNEVLTVLYRKIEGETAVKEDVYSAQKNWLNKKRVLHIVIPHTEIKEIDLWLSETVTLVEDKEWKDAISKVEVLIELTEQIPKTFSLLPENIF
jgi:hypothetical protein